MSAGLAISCICNGSVIPRFHADTHTITTAAPLVGTLATLISMRKGRQTWLNTLSSRGTVCIYGQAVRDVGKRMNHAEFTSSRLRMHGAAMGRIARVCATTNEIDRPPYAELLYWQRMDRLATAHTLLVV